MTPHETHKKKRSTAVNVTQRRASPNFLKFQEIKTG
jgi:hypothetical protein